MPITEKTLGCTAKYPAECMYRRVIVAVTEAEYDALVQEAREAGFRSLAEYIRTRKLFRPDNADAR